jgi:poly-beta-1,6-N-acetyl-D-glucosamine synthase
MQSRRYIIITPVRDEVSYIGQTINAVTSQTILPIRWVVVDDGSTDGTADVLAKQTVETDWLKVIHRPNRGHRANGTGVMEAFHEGLATLAAHEWDYLVKLDGDLSFDPDYFEKCFAMFDADSSLGIGGGTVCRIESGTVIVDSVGDPPFHVRGATKIYRRQCWEAIRPLANSTGWDTIDEIKANHIGWSTRTFAAITLIQHKPTGGADGAWRNNFKNGRANYLSGYHPAFLIAKCIKRSMARPFVIGSIALFSGYLSGYLRRIPKAAEPHVVRYLQKQQISRLLNKPSLYKQQGMSAGTQMSGLNPR